MNTTKNLHFPSPVFCLLYVAGREGRLTKVRGRLEIWLPDALSWAEAAIREHEAGLLELLPDDGVPTEWTLCPFPGEPMIFEFFAPTETVKAKLVALGAYPWRIGVFPRGAPTAADLQSQDHLSLQTLAGEFDDADRWLLLAVLDGLIGGDVDAVRSAAQLHLLDLYRARVQSEGQS